MKNQALLHLVLCSALLPFALQAGPQDKPGDGNRPELKKIFERLDTNTNGTLSRSEAKGPIARKFDEIDLNADGELSKRELRAQADKRRSQKGEANTGPGNRGDNQADRSDNKRPNPGLRFRKIDTDRNGAISLKEAEAAGLKKLVKHFERVDKDKNGEISKKEIRAMRKARQQREREGRTGGE